jgi:hypothetical protein
MAHIFLSYRGEDEPYGAAVLDRELSRWLRSVFRAPPSLTAGVDAVLLDVATQAAALVAVIGPGWLAAADEAGERRVFREDDPVRAQLAAALAAGVLVVPVLLDTGLPAARQLPGSIAGLARCAAVQLRSGRPDTGALVGELVSRVPGLAAELTHASEAPWTWTPRQGVPARPAALDAYLAGRLAAGQQAMSSRAALVDAVLRAIGGHELVVTVAPCRFSGSTAAAAALVLTDRWLWAIDLGRLDEDEPQWLRLSLGEIDRVLVRHGAAGTPFPASRVEVGAGRRRYQFSGLRRAQADEAAAGLQAAMDEIRGYRDGRG